MPERYSEAMGVVLLFAYPRLNIRRWTNSDRKTEKRLVAMQHSHVPLIAAGTATLLLCSLVFNGVFGTVPPSWLAGAPTTLDDDDRPPSAASYSLRSPPPPRPPPRNR
jgi:hypothetical protein